MKSNNTKNKIELLAPAGNIEKMKTSLAFGADAVYAGIPDFSLRVRINDFTLEKIKEATNYCHENKKKIYITINIFAHNEHIKKLPTYIKKLKEIGVDALIITDPGVIGVVKKVWPKAELHLSTQANCTNWQSAQFWQKQGIKRIILGREVTLEEIKEIHKNCPKLELEIFVHGAMCMAYSGRCFLSKYFVGKSGNLGDCVQPCRWKYKTRNAQGVTHNSLIIAEEKRLDMPLELVEEMHGSYILNSKDLCLIKYLEKLIDAGVVSFKIEGRAKSVYYQSMIAGIYKKAIDTILKKEKDSPSPRLRRTGKNTKNTKKELDYLYKELNTKLMHRGYTEGFLLGEKADQNIEESHVKSDWEFCGVVCNTSGSEETHCHVSVHNSLKVGDTIEIVVPFYDIIKLKLKSLVDEKTGEKIKEAHGGQKRIVIIETNKKIPKYSVLRRKI